MEAPFLTLLIKGESSSESIVRLGPARPFPLSLVEFSRSLILPARLASFASSLMIVLVCPFVAADFGGAVPHRSSDDRQVPSGSTVTESILEGHVLRISSKNLGFSWCVSAVSKKYARGRKRTRNIYPSTVMSSTLTTLLQIGQFQVGVCSFIMKNTSASKQAI